MTEQVQGIGAGVLLLLTVGGFIARLLNQG